MARVDVNKDGFVTGLDALLLNAPIATPSNS